MCFVFLHLASYLFLRCIGLIIRPLRAKLADLARFILFVTVWATKKLSHLASYLLVALFRVKTPDVCSVLHG